MLNPPRQNQSVHDQATTHLGANFHSFLRIPPDEAWKLEIDVAPLLEEDAVLAADKRPDREELVDALIAATVSRYDSLIWTRDTDYLRFLPKEKVVIIQQASHHPSEATF
jgi:predicted nucleic acid-binding protein